MSLRYNEKLIITVNFQGKTTVDEVLKFKELIECHYNKGLKIEIDKFSVSFIEVEE